MEEPALRIPEIPAPSPPPPPPSAPPFIRLLVGCGADAITIRDEVANLLFSVLIATLLAFLCCFRALV